MRRLLPSVVVGALVLASTPLIAQRQLTLAANVSDPSGANVTEIAPQAVSITENGMAAKIVKVEVLNQTPKVQVLIDNGLGYPSDGIPALRNGLRALVEALPPEIEVALYTTAPQPRTLQALTADRQRLLSAIDRLAPDSGAGRFVESLAEATQRIERDANGRYAVISLATSAGDSNVRDRDISDIQNRVIKLRPIVHVVHLTLVGRTSGGAVQTDLGIAVTKLSGGRYEGINSASRVVSLLPELGAEVAKTLGATKVMRVTFERPAGATGELGRVGLSVTGKAISDVVLVE
jgi:hypothetical protein